MCDLVFFGCLLVDFHRVIYATGVDGILDFVSDLGIVSFALRSVLFKGEVFLCLVGSESTMERVLFVIRSKFLLVFLVIGFASRYKVLEEYAVIDDLYVEDEERTEASDADTVHVVIADQLLAVGNLIQA